MDLGIILALALGFAAGFSLRHVMALIARRNRRAPAPIRTEWITPRERMQLISRWN